jgi:peroxiredoxin
MASAANHNHPHGKAVNVLKFGENNKIIVDEPSLKKMFMHPEVKNRKVVAFSIIGAFRKGKSFFLDYCLRFLYANVSLQVDKIHCMSLNCSFSTVSIDQLPLKPHQQQGKLDGRRN